MQSRKKTNLFRKYFIIVSTVIFLSFVVLGGALLLFISNSWLSEKKQLLDENAQSIAKTTSELVNSGYMKKNEKGSVLLICNTLSLLSSAIDADIYISDTDGQVIYCRDLLRADMIVMPGTCNIHNKYYLPAQVIQQAIETGSYSDISDLGGMYENTHLVVAKPIFAGEQAIGIVFATQPVAALLGPYVISMLRMFGFASLLAMAIAFIPVYYMFYRMTKPLRRMSAATRRFAAGDFSYRVKVSGKDEIGRASCRERV